MKRRTVTGAESERAEVEAEFVRAGNEEKRQAVAGDVESRRVEAVAKFKGAREPESERAGGPKPLMTGLCCLQGSGRGSLFIMISF